MSGSSDFTIRLWDIECGECLRVLEGHDELVRCIRFDNKRIVSGAYDGKIKIWDLKLALEQRSSASSLCIQTLTVSFSFLVIATLPIIYNSNFFELLKVIINKNEEYF